MEKSKIDMFLSMNSENFNAGDLAVIRKKLEDMDEEKLFMIQSTSFQKPITIFVLAFFLGWERFWLEDITLGVVKILTCYGCGIWWLIDLFTAMDRARSYNFQKFMKTTSFL